MSGTERRAQLIERMRRDPPAYVVVGRRDANPFEPLDSLTSLEQFTELFELVYADYEREREIGRFVTLRRMRGVAPKADQDSAAAK